MKKFLVILSLALTVSLVYACTLLLGHPAESKTVEVEIACAIDGTVFGSKTTGMIGDSNVLSVSVIAQDSSGTVLETASLTKGDNSWTGSMRVTVTEATTVAFSARGYSGTEATGSILYCGKSEVTVSPSDESLNVSISTTLQQTAQWARSVSAGSGSSEFRGVSVDSSGNVYATGHQNGSGTYTYGAGVSATGSAAGSVNVVLVKYNSSGAAQWAKTVSAGSNGSRFFGVSVDTAGNVYAAGFQYGTGSFTYGTDVSATGTYAENVNVVLVKYGK